MNDQISRQAVLDMAYDMSEIDGEHFEDMHMVVDVDDILKLSSAEKTGQWVKKEDDKCYWYECDQCGQKPLKNRFNAEDELSPCCPWCGARMS